MIIKGIDKRYLVETKMNAEQIANNISSYLGETVNTITILSAGWDAYFGNYSIVRTARNRHWIVSNGEIIPYNSFAKERDL